MWIPDLVGFGELFADPKEAGFPDRSCILIAGPPGGGKSTLALTLARSLLTQYEEEHIQLLLFSAEADWNTLARDFSPFGWFSDRDSLFNQERLQVMTMPDYQKPRSGEPVNYVLAEVGKFLGERNQNPVILLVDSITAILKDSADIAERRGEAHRLITKLGNSLANRIFPLSTIGQARSIQRSALIIVTSEQSLDVPVHGTEPPPEEYVADVVVKLARKHTGSGQRLRTFSISKSRASNMRMGEHTFAIVTPESIGDVIAEEGMEQLVRQKGTRTASGDGKWATVTISPRPLLQSLRHANERSGPVDTVVSVPAEDRSGPRIWTGTPGLDAMLEGRDDYWGNPTALANPSSHQSLIPGSVTLVLGSSGSGKSLLSLQFLACTTEPEESMYVNFESSRKELLRMLPSERLAKHVERCRFLYRRRSNLDFNLWLSELRHAIANPLNGRTVTRLAIDGLSDLLSTTPEKEYSRMVETLLSSVRTAGKGKVTVFVTYEIEPNFADFAPPTPGLSVTADNVIVLRQISIHDELRNSVYILKARKLRHDRQVRELNIRETRGTPSLTIDTGFEYFGNLLTGKPEPLDIAVQLFAENEAETKFNKYLLEHISNRFGKNIRPVAFSRPEITRSLGDAISVTSPIARSDIRILSVDEWWIREYGEKSRVTSATVPHPLLSLNRFVVMQGSGQFAQSQFWLSELEKASQSRPGHLVSQELSPRCDLLAIPNYMDFGLFCISQQRVESMHSENQTAAGLADSVPRVWTLMRGRNFVLPTDQPPASSIVGFLERAKNMSVNGFAFDMQTVETFVCFFFELCWAFGEDENFLITRALQVSPDSDPSTIDSIPITTAVRFLQYLVRHRLMPVRTDIARSKVSLLSRQWYSSLVANNDLKPQVVPVPFFPVGAIDVTAREPDVPSLVAAWKDAAERFSELVDRVLAVAASQESQQLSLLNSLSARIKIEFSSLSNVQQIGNQDALRSAVARLRSAGQELESLVSNSPEFVIRKLAVSPDQSVQPTLLPAVYWMDYRDIRELMAQHQFRLALIQGQLDGRTLRDVIGRDSDTTTTNQQGATTQFGITSLTGYTCTGSWLIGSLRTSHSPRVCWRVIEELTSLPVAITRAREGAGIPPRKDFYEFYGQERVMSASHLTWNSLLLYTSARARRRDRAVCLHVRLADISDLIYSRVSHCMALADESKLSLEDLDKAACSAIRDLLVEIRSRMEAASSNGDSECECIKCTSKCWEAIKNRRSAGAGA